MKNSKYSPIKMTFLLATLMISSSSFAAKKGDAKAGAKKAVTCYACHGNKGISSNDLWPNLQGQKIGYMVKQLKDFKSGARKDPLMSPQAAALSEQDMLNISAYFNSLK